MRKLEQLEAHLNYPLWFLAHEGNESYWNLLNNFTGHWQLLDDTMEDALMDEIEKCLN